MHARSAKTPATRTQAIPQTEGRGAGTTALGSSRPERRNQPKTVWDPYRGFAAGVQEGRDAAGRRVNQIDSKTGVSTRGSTDAGTSKRTR